MKSKTPKRQKAKEIKRNDGAVAYRLEGSDRLEWLTPRRAFARSRSRSDNRQWKVDPEAFADEVKESPIPAGKAEWQHRLAEGIRKDNETAAIRIESMQKAEAMSKEKTATATKEKSTKTTTNTAGGKARAEWKGVGMCALIRYAGKKGFGKTKTMTLMKKIGLDPDPATVSIQLRKGVKGENVPEIAKETRVELIKYADAIPNDEKRAPKAEGSKKAGKKKDKAGKAEGKKKAPKTETAAKADDDEEAALAQARSDAADAESEEEETDAE